MSCYSGSYMAISICHTVQTVYLKSVHFSICKCLHLHHIQKGRMSTHTCELSCTLDVTVFELIAIVVWLYFCFIRKYLQYLNYYRNLMFCEALFRPDLFITSFPGLLVYRKHSFIFEINICSYYLTKKCPTLSKKHLFLWGHLLLVDSNFLQF